MSKLKINFIISLVILGVLIGFIVLSPLTAEVKYSEVSKAQLLQRENDYIIEFRLMNHEGEVQNYTITGLIDGKSYIKNVRLSDGRVFTYIHHIQPDRIDDGNVSFTIRKEGEDIPFEQINYYLNVD